MEENKQMMELLQQIEKSSRQQARNARFQTLLALVAAVFCIGVFVLIFNFLPQVDAVVSQMQVVLSNMEKTTQELASLDLQGMMDGIDTLVASGQDGLQQTMDKLNMLDIETLNKAIKDLAAVIEPLAKVSNMFK